VLAFLVVVAGAIVLVRNLLAVTMLTGIYSLLVATLFVLLDAVDVALTEAAVGAGLLVILMLGTIALTTRREHVEGRGQNLLALAVVLVTGGALIYGTLDMPHFGDAAAPAHVHVSPRFTQDSVSEIGIPNMVTSVLASYRGIDTLGETVVIFAAAVGVLLVLGSGTAGRRRSRDRASGTDPEERI
jgi:multicomponent Na+:H+ antiporter subunit B